MDIGSLVVKISANLTEFEKGLQEVEKSTKQLGGKFQDVGKKLTIGLTTPIVGAGGLGVKAFGDFETSVAKVGTMLGGTNKTMADVKDETKALSSEFATAQADISEAMYQAISAGVEATETQEFLAIALKAAKGGFTDPATAVDGLTSVINS